MAGREGSIILKPEEWYDVSDARRDFYLTEARARARASFGRIVIKVKDRFGTRPVATIDARFWTFDPVKDVDLPAPRWIDIIRAEERQKKYTRHLKNP
jgi:hypothetical protein